MQKARKSQGEIVAKLRRIEALRASGMTITQAVNFVGATEVEYRKWRAEYGGLLRTLLWEPEA